MKIIRDQLERNMKSLRREIRELHDPLAERMHRLDGELEAREPVDDWDGWLPGDPEEDKPANWAEQRKVYLAKKHG